MGRPTKLTTERAEAFFAAMIAAAGNVTRACEAVGIARMTAYQWREEVPEFAAAWEKAQKLGAEVLEDAMRERAVYGVREPIYHQGEMVGTVQKYSDTLAIFLAKGAMPEKYRERSQVDVSGHLAITEMSEADLRAELAALGAALPAADDAADLV